MCYDCIRSILKIISNEILPLNRILDHFLRSVEILALSYKT